MRHVRLALSTAGGDYVVARGDEPRDEERSNVPGSADDDDSNGGLLTGCALARLQCLPERIAISYQKPDGASRHYRTESERPVHEHG